jgi:hypothetical protein
VIAAAVVPHPPLLVPALTGGGADQAAGLLPAVDAAVAALLAEAPQLVVCVGDGARTTPHPTRAWGTLAGFGVDLAAPSGPQPGRPTLPLSLTLGGWLLERAGWRGQVLLHEVAVTAAPDDALALGRRLASDAGEHAAWLVLGDACSTRTEQSPGYYDPRAEPFDAAVAAALAAGDVAALASLDALLAAELGAAGRAPWQVLAGALGRHRAARGMLRYDAAPYGVGYLVANWWPG